jgi:hypothetical protein
MRWRLEFYNERRGQRVGSVPNRERQEYDMTRHSRLAMILVLTVLLALATTQLVGGEVPTAADFAACNEHSPQAIKAGSASPIVGDHARAASARGEATTAANSTGRGIESSDPQIHGMEAEGAKNATYQAAYRSCMRRKGF